MREQDGEENFAIAMEFAHYHSTYHSFLDCDTRAVEKVYEELGHRLGLNAQLGKQARIRGLVQEFMGDWAAWRVDEERRLRREAQQAGHRHAPTLPRETVDLPHRILSLLHCLAGNPLSTPTETSGRGLSLQEGVADDSENLDVVLESSWEKGSGGSRENFGTWDASSASSDLSSWTDEDDEEELELGEAEQARREEASDSGVESRRESGAEASTALQICAASLEALAFEGQVLEWAESLREARNLAATDCGRSEAIAVRHALLMMQGIPGEIFTFCEERRAFSANPGFFEGARLSSTLLEPLIRGSTSWRQMRAITMQLERSAAPPTQAAFGSCLNSYLLELQQEPRHLEMEFVNGGSASLLHLHHRTADWVTRVASLESCVDYVWPNAHVRPTLDNAQISSFILDRLYTLCGDDYFLGGCRTLRSKIFPIFMGTLQPILETLDGWVSQGELDDPCGEFFVKRDHSVPWDSNDFWSEGFVLRAPGSEMGGCLTPTFLAGQQNIILVAGKSAALAKNGRASQGNALAAFESRGSLVASVKEGLASLRPSADNDESAGPVLRPHSPPNMHEGEEGHLPGTPHLGPAALQGAEGSLDESIALELQSRFDFREHWGMHVLLRADRGGRQPPQLFRPSPLLREEGHLKDIFALASALEGLDTGPPVVLIEKTIKAHLLRKATAIDTALIHLLKDKWGFMRQINIVESTFMMGSSGFMQTFTSRLFTFMSSKWQWDDVGEVSVILRESLAESGLASHIPDGAFSVELSPKATGLEQDEDCLPDATVKSLSTLHVGIQHNIRELERIRLKYRVPWPVHMIISEDSLTRYNNLFVFLLQVKYAKHEMDKLQGLFTAGQFERKVQENIFSGAPQAMRWNRIEHLRHEILHFTHVIHHWLLIGFHSNAHPRLEKRLEEVTGFDGILRLHEDFLQDSSLQALIGSEKLWKSVAVRIKEILGLALRFADACRLVLELDKTKASIQSTTAVVARSNSDLQSIDRHFRSSLTFLFTILSSSMRVARNEPLSDLITALNFNGFYDIHV